MTFSKAYINITKLAAEIRKNNFQPGRHRQVVFVGNGKRESGLPDEEKMRVSYTINLESGAPVEFTYFDFVVADALYSLRHNKEEMAVRDIKVSLSEVLRIMSGDVSQTVTKAKKERIRSSIEKLAGTDICIDFSSEAKLRNLPGNCVTYLSGPFAPLTAVEGKPDRYRFNGCMPLYSYAEQINQIINYPVSLLRTDLSDTNEVIMIKHYLVKRLEMLRHPRNTFLSAEISLFRRAKSPGSGKWGGLMPEIGISIDSFSGTESWNRKLRSVGGSVMSLLDEYQKRGYIYGYTVRTERGIPMKFTILRNDKAQSDNGDSRCVSNPWNLE